MALEAIKRSGKPAVITLAVPGKAGCARGRASGEAARRLEAAGAEVVGLNCSRGPATMMPLLREIRSAVDCHVAALPVPYRTTPAEPTFQSLTDPDCKVIPDNRPFPAALDPFVCNRYEIAEFGKRRALGVRYLGVCCGAGPHHVRGLAEGLGRRPRRAVTPPTCRSTSSSARTLPCNAAIRTTRRLPVRTCVDTRPSPLEPLAVHLVAELAEVFGDGCRLDCCSADHAVKCRLSVRTCSREVSTRYRSPR